MTDEYVGIIGICTQELDCTDATRYFSSAIATTFHAPTKRRKEEEEEEEGEEEEEEDGVDEEDKEEATAKCSKAVNRSSLFIFFPKRKRGEGMIEESRSTYSSSKISIYM